MSEKTPVADEEQQQCPLIDEKTSAFKSLGWLDRFLAVWIFLAMVIGILLGNFVPNIAQSFEKGQFVGVSVPIGESVPEQDAVAAFQSNVSAPSLKVPSTKLLAVGLLVMMYPILCKVRYETLHDILREKEIWRQMAFSVFINWIVAPFFMVSLFYCSVLHHFTQHIPSCFTSQCLMVHS